MYWRACSVTLSWSPVFPNITVSKSAVICWKHKHMRRRVLTQTASEPWRWIHLTQQLSRVELRRGQRTPAPTRLIQALPPDLLGRVLIERVLLVLIGWVLLGRGLLVLLILIGQVLLGWVLLVLLGWVLLVLLWWVLLILIRWVLLEWVLLGLVLLVLVLLGWGLQSPGLSVVLEHGLGLSEVLRALHLYTVTSSSPLIPRPHVTPPTRTPIKTSQVDSQEV